MRIPRVLRASALPAVLLAACTANPPRPPVAEESPVPVRGGVLRVLFAEDVDSLDPHRASRPGSWFVARALHRGLMAFPNLPYPAGARPVADLASAEPTVSGDGLRYTFRLRGDVRFGAPASRKLVAADVVASLKRSLRAGGAVAAGLDVVVGAPSFAAGRAGNVAGLRAPNPSTVVIRLSRPAADLLSVLAHPQLSVVPAQTKAPGAGSAVTIAPSGPYRISSYDPERSLTLVRNPEWKASSDPVRSAYVDRIEARMNVAAARAGELVAAGAADVIADAGAPDAGTMAFPSGARRVLAASGCVRYLFMNAGSSPLGSTHARRAVAALVRRSMVAPAGASIAERILPATVTGHDGSAAIREDLAAARASLAAADRSGGFSTTLVVGNSKRDRREAAAVRTSLARAGVRVFLRVVDADVLHRHYYEQPGAAPMGIATWCADFPGLAGAGVLQGVQAYTGATVAADEIRSARAIAGPGAEKAWRMAETVLLRAATVVPLYRPADLVALSARVQGYAPSPMWVAGDPANLWVAAE